MVTVSIVLVFLINIFLVKSSLRCDEYQKLVVTFTSYESNQPFIILLTSSVFLYPKQSINEYFILNGSKTSENQLSVRQVQYKYGSSILNCPPRFLKSVLYFTLEGLISSECVIGLMRYNADVFRRLEPICLPHSLINLTCIIRDLDKPDPINKNDDSGRTLFSVLFLSTCIGLTCFICLGWFAFVYCRRCRLQRIEKKQAKALEHSVQQILEKLPIIIFDSKIKEQRFFDNEDPVCSICLESFKENEKLRKLVCPHYFHVACIDPWLLTHQNCPLCNQNILTEIIPTISGRFSMNENPRSNSSDSSISVRNQSTIRS